MTDDRFARRLPALMDELAGHDDLYVEDILGLTTRMRQRSPWTFPRKWLPLIGPRRDRRTSTVARLAIVGVAVVIATAVGLNLMPRTGSSGPGAPSPSPSPSPSALASPPASPSPTALAYTWPTRLAPGSYSTSLIWSPDLVFSFTVPEGWDSRDIEIIKGNRMALQFYVIENLVADVCGEELANPPVDRWPEAIATALSNLVSVKSGPMPVTVGDRSGTYLEYTVGPELGCAPTDFRLMKLPAGICGVGCGGIGSLYKGLEFGEVPEHNRVWILVVGRGHAVIDALWTPEATAADLTELQAVIDSVRLDTPNATPPPVPASIEP